MHEKQEVIYSEADVREAIRRERDRLEATVTHQDAEDEVVARLREMLASGATSAQRRPRRAGPPRPPPTPVPSSGRKMTP
jgi:hypothetical protein